MKAIIKDSHTKEELSSGCLCVTPSSFSTVKNWGRYQVEGISYYVDKAVSFGASRVEKARKLKRTPRSDK